ncbi:MAG TPA: hypothetical protein PLI34_14575 [Saprospiraceae bacterium]|nr:hypothetical protein [Saprospiraceae bacterium]
MSNLFSSVFGSRSALILAFFAAILLFPTCNEDNVNMVNEGTLTFKVNNKTYNSKAAVAILIEEIGLYTVNINSVFTSGISVDLTFGMGITRNTTEFIGNHEYDNSGCDLPRLCSSMYVSFGLLGLPHSTDDGSLKLNITEASIVNGGNIAGTFSGTAVNIATGESVNVTDGKFNLKIQQ